MRIKHRLYASPNGDLWSICRGADAADVYVLHEPNRPSGGQDSRIEIGAFLSGAPGSPECAELLRLIGSLLERAAIAPPRTAVTPEPGAAAAEPTPGEAAR
ncbi:hypothetical protein [Methylobacterium nigriterrae]|uniref:hypothetical protein n=1 Tax=Methylobacterium nigriterrae TaxID=3127512 RepID=UPI003013247A